MDIGETIGKRIRTLRGNQYSQRELAEKAGVSVDLVRKLEQGVRHTASIDKLQDIANALDVPVSDLLGERTSLPTTGEGEGVLAIRRAISPVNDLTGDAFEESALTLRNAKRAVESLWGAYWFGNYQVLGKLLPKTLGQLRATRRAVPVADAPRAAHLLALGYQAAGDTLVHLGQQDAAFMAIREAMAVAEDGEDPLLPSSLRVSVAWQLLVQGRYSESEKVATVAAQQIEPSGDVSESHIAAFGLLAATGATAAARSQNPGSAGVLLDIAKESADRLGCERADHCSTFGPIKVGMMAVDVEVVQDNFTTALTAARRIPREGLPLASRARHMADLALCHARLRHNDKATDILLAMESMAPQWIRQQTLPKQVARELLGRERPSRLREFAARQGVHV